jgi:hypothetical protein
MPGLAARASLAPILTTPSRNNGAVTRKQTASDPCVAASLEFCAPTPDLMSFAFSLGAMFYVSQLPFVLVLIRTASALRPERFVMNGDKVDSNMTSIPSVSLFRGIYNRVAKRLGVDPSYVSRVARGERKSAVVEKALAEEVRLIRDHLNNHQNGHNNNNHTAAEQKKKSKITSRPGESLEI